MLKKLNRTWQKKIKSNHDTLLNYLVVFDDRVSKVEKLTSSVSSLVQTANLKISENSNELDKIGTGTGSKVDLKGTFFFDWKKWTFFLKGVFC